MDIDSFYFTIEEKYEMSRYEAKIFKNSFCNKLKINYIDNSINKAIIRHPNSKSEQNYKVKFLKKLEKDYNKLYKFNFNKKTLYYIADYHMEIRADVYDIYKKLRKGLGL